MSERSRALTKVAAIVSTNPTLASMAFRGIPNVRYVVEWTDGQGNPKRKTFVTKEGALACQNRKQNATLIER